MNDCEKEFELTPFGTNGMVFEEEESKPKPNYRPVDWSSIGSNERRCKGCDVWKKEKNIEGDFICKHIRGYAEAPAKVRRCYGCNVWKKEKGIKGNFWCKHNKLKKEEWDSRRGWRGASVRAKEISEWRRQVQSVS